MNGEGLPDELVVLLAAAAAARAAGMRNPTVRVVAPTPAPAPAPGPWVWVGRSSQMEGRRAVQRRGHQGR